MCGLSPLASFYFIIIIIIIIIIIVVVVVVEDDTNYWVYLSSDYLFQVYYKVRQLFLLQSTMVCYYKVRQLFYYKVRQVLLQSATGITKCDNFITKCDRYYKVRRLLQSATVNFITKCNGLLLQSATAFLLQSTTSVITMCDNFTTKSDWYYKV